MKHDDYEYYKCVSCRPAECDFRKDWSNDEIVCIRRYDFYIKKQNECYIKSQKNKAYWDKMLNSEVLVVKIHKDFSNISPDALDTILLRFTVREVDRFLNSEEGQDYYKL